jgi:hypothetical protein
MTTELKYLINQYYSQEITRQEIISNLDIPEGKEADFLRKMFDNIFTSLKSDDVGYGLTILSLFEKDDEYIDIIHRLILESWHNQYEDIAHDLQKRGNIMSIPFLKEAMQKKYFYLESYGTGTRQFINQCGHALYSIGTKEAIEVIRELSKSEDPVLKDEMLYRISRIEARNDYERNYDI